MSKTKKNINKKYNRVARFYDLVINPMDAMSPRKWRLELMEELEGRVLEVGVGTGKNIELYPDNLDIVAIDFSEKMLEKAKEKAQVLGKEINLINMDVENLEFDDNSFDTVFTSCVFCSVPNPIKGLKEIRRVCKPGGKIIMIEHVRSEKKLLGLLMDLFNPITLNLIGTNINRNTVGNIYDAGFDNVEVTNLSKDIMKKIIIYNDK